MPRKKYYRCLFPKISIVLETKLGPDQKKFWNEAVGCGYVSYGIKANVFHLVKGEQGGLSTTVRPHGLEGF